MELFRELEELHEIINSLGDLIRVEELAEVPCGKIQFPLLSLSFGPANAELPVIAFFGGVHGLERIGTHVLLSYLKTLSQLLQWDESAKGLFSKTRLLFVPLVNPGGMFLHRRANPNNVDLMRNSPSVADEFPTAFIFGGHRISPRLPWYRGKEGEMEIESKAICEFVRKHIYPAKIAISLDVHSGYGTEDRLWFPYARSKTPFPDSGKILALKKRLDETYPNHIYRIEPQSRHYLAHGDLWDYLYDEYRSQSRGVYLPLSLELGSWAWVKKNRRQLFSLLGIFNPIAPHRLARTLRRHMTLFDFLHKSVYSSNGWGGLSLDKEEAYKAAARALWYDG